MSSFSIFISHDTRDQTLAELLKTLLEQIFLNAEVFVSGRDLSGGDVWIQEIRTRLTSSSSIIALVTALSLDNPWVLFESGAGFIEGKTIPVVAGGLSFSDLPKPFQLLQVRMYDSEGLKKLVMDVARLGQARAPLRYPGLDDTIVAADEFLRLRASELAQERRSTSQRSSHQGVVEYRSDTRDAKLTERHRELEAKTRNVIIRSIKRAEASATIPTDAELAGLSLGDLTQLADYTNVPYPSLAVTAIRLFGMTIPSLDDSKWKKLNAEQELARLEAEIAKFERSLDANVT